MPAPGIVIGGTTSDAGKSLITVGLCRVLRRRGRHVAPFKAQNMSNNSMIVPGGDEIGRAQWLQALAAGVEPSSAMNPVLLKPGSDMRSHIVVRGRPYGSVHSRQWREVKASLRDAAFEGLADMRERFDVVVAEGAGSPAEINLRDGDFTNLGLARYANWPMVVVGNIDIGGVLAAFYGTLAIVDEADQRHIAGFLVNNFRGHRDLLTPGLTAVEDLTGRQVLGVVPHLDNVWMDAEDSLAVRAVPQHSDSPTSLHVAIVRFPRMSNTTDVDALAAEPGVGITWAASPTDIARADLVILPGSRATVADLAWLRHRSLDTAITERAQRQQPVLGICGGFQMLGRSIRDDVESESAEEVAGLGLLPHDVTFSVKKTTGLPRCSWNGHCVSAFEVHHGRESWHETPDPFPGGGSSGSTFGTHWHATLENDEFRRTFLQMVARAAGSPWTPHRSAPGFAQQREDMIDSLADALEEHTDVDAWLRLIDEGVPESLPVRRAGF